MTELTRGIPVTFGGVEAIVFGGPFPKFKPGTRRLFSVKMAAEIDHPHDVSVPTEDFSVPDRHDMEEGLKRAITAIFQGKDVYAGCKGGIGRTGLFMGCMTKVMTDYAEMLGHPVQSPKDPVLYVRKHYLPHAMETKEQQDYVRNFDTAPIIRHIKNLTAPRIMFKDRVVEVEKPVEVFPPFWVYMAWWFSGGWLPRR